MTYAQLDDSMPDHPKIATLPVEARWAFVRSICYSSRYLTDGVVPRLIAESWEGQAAAAALVSAGLWINTGENYTVHDYLDWNRSRAEVVASKERARERAAHSRRTRSAPSVVVDAVEAEKDKKERERDELWDAVAAWYGSQPAGDERGAWNKALKTFRQAVPPVSADEIARLFDEAQRQWTKPFKPTAVASNLTSLRASLKPRRVTTDARYQPYDHEAHLRALEEIQ